LQQAEVLHAELGGRAQVQQMVTGMNLLLIVVVACGQGASQPRLHSAVSLCSTAVQSSVQSFNWLAVLCLARGLIAAMVSQTFFVAQKIAGIRPVFRVHCQS
jgi:hypothetical protein